jgi:hypothetical protein
VHQVFGWLDLPDATGALRRYWREHKLGKEGDVNPSLAEDD